MNAPFTTDEEFFDLMYDLVENRLSPESHLRLEAVLSQNAARQQQYVDFMLVVSGLHRTCAEHEGVGRPLLGEAGNVLPLWPNDIDTLIPEEEDANSRIPPILLDLATPPQRSPGLFALGGVLSSYAASTIIVIVGLFIAWSSTISHSPQIADVTPAPHTEPTVIPEPQMHFVGRITGMVDCQWTDPANEAAEGSFVLQGRKYALASGLLEITYDTGAKVILQGPCSYEVDTGDGGFLALGKLTARVEKKAASGQGPVAGEAATKNHSPLATHHLPLFTVRTPTSIVTDLGTEFAVEVDKSGASQAHVFRGKVAVRSVQGGKHSAFLNENESARVAAGQNTTIEVSRRAIPAASFARKMPKRSRIRLVNTGVGVKEGQDDPRWQIAARTDDPNFKPRPAVVMSIPVHYRPGDPPGVGHLYSLPNNPAESQWISLAQHGNQPENTTYTFRTTFELEDLIPSTAVLRGRFIVDDHVSAIRLNGRNLQVPKHPWTWVFFTWHEFLATEGFVEGTNVLEIDVFNGKESGSSSKTTDQSGLSCRVELEGSAFRRWQSPAVSNTSQPTKSESKEPY